MSVSQELAANAYRAKQRVNILSVFVNVSLSGLKLAGGIIGQSNALIADAVHSLSDLATDALVIFATRMGSAEADDDHPYGHVRFETAATLALSLLLVIVAFGIMTDAVNRLFTPDTLLRPGLLALVVAAVSIVANEILFQYGMRVARKWRSPLLKANAWHHRSDAISSVVVLIGIGGAMSGLSYLDSVGAIVVAVMIAKIGWDLGWPSIRELVDTAAEPDTLDAIRTSIAEVEGVEALHLLRTRRMGENILIDVHIVVPPKVSVSEGHQTAERVRAHVMDAVAEVTDVTVHIDPEDDEIWIVDTGLPGREEILAQLKLCWESLDFDEHIRRVDLHYLEGKIHVDVIVDFAAVSNIEHAKVLTATIIDTVHGIEQLGRVIVLYR